MKDEEVVQALRCCAKGFGHDDAYKKLRSKYCPHCGARMDGAAE